MFYKLPTLLITDKKYKQLSNDAKLLYMFLLARSDLSFKNGWVDGEFKPYIYCSREEMAGFLNVSAPTAVKIFRQLTDSGLVKQCQKTKTRSKRLYVKNLLSNKELIKSKEQNEFSLPRGDEISELIVKQYMNS